ncbi:MAG: tetratricopeptide repeat protein, partial [Terriglobia bacterium]
LRQEADQLKQEAEAIRQQGQKEDQERAACNRAFSAFATARKTTSDEEAIAHYREGLRLCPSDDVGHNELGEIYLRMGRRSEAATEFNEALRLNPNFSRAQKNLSAAQ